MFTRLSARGRAWIYLILAVLSEVFGLMVMKYAMVAGTVFSTIVGHLILYSLIAIAYVLLAKAVCKISVSVAYTIWEGSGIALITLLSWYVFAHQLTPHELLGIALAILGILLVNAGHRPSEIANEITSRC